MADPNFDDGRLDPRVKAFLKSRPPIPLKLDLKTREEILSHVATPQFTDFMAQVKAMQDSVDNEIVAPSKGLIISQEKIVSGYDGNTIHLQIIRPANGQKLACLYYIHGGAMCMFHCFGGARPKAG